ncbi:hypothetical protein KR032_007066, partial [Drosophila birchii]
IFTCIEVVGSGIADLSKEILPRLNELIKCVRFDPEEELDNLDTESFRAVVSAFLLKLVQGPSCLDSFQEGIMGVIKPHKEQFSTHKCAY